MKKELDLSGLWELRPVERLDGKYGGRWYRQEIPGHWQALEQFKDYSGRMVYRRSFAFSPEKGKRYWLKLNGVFYWAAAYLNGARLGANQAAFTPALFECTEALKTENEIVMEVLCEDEPDKLRKKQILGVFHHWDCMFRDFNPGGIWQPIEIFSAGPVAIRDAAFHTTYLHAQYARIQGKVSFDSREREDFEFKINLAPENHSGPGFEKSWMVCKPAGEKSYSYSLDLENYKLWSTWDTGAPNLYQLRIEARRRGDPGPCDVWETFFGVRTFELRDYIGYLNGRRIWLRGSNYAPGDFHIATMDRKRYEQDLALAKDANMNMLRVHAHLEKPEFYEIADRNGILLWQDFPLQWAYDRAVLPEVLFQVEEMINLLRNHPSIGIWCMHNEPFLKHETRKKPGLIDWARLAGSILFKNWNRDVLDKKLLKKARYLDPFRPSLQSSGEKGLFAKDEGDSHLYFGWFFGSLPWLSWIARRRPKRVKLVSEFGSQSLPNYQSAIKFMPSKWEKIDWEALCNIYLAQPEYLGKFIPRKNYKDLQSYIDATQEYQSVLNRYYIDLLRSLKYRPCGGALTFELNDPNPAITWSVLDYWRVPKKSYSELKKAFSPVYAFALLEKFNYELDRTVSIPIFAVNDSYLEVEAHLSARLVSPIQEELFKQEFEVKLGADSLANALANPMVHLRWPGKYRLELKLAGKDRALENNYDFIAR